MLTVIEKNILNDLKEIQEYSMPAIKENILSLSQEDKADYIKDLAKAYNYTVKEVKRAVNYFIYDIEEYYN